MRADGKSSDFMRIRKKMRRRRRLKLTFSPPLLFAFFPLLSRRRDGRRGRRLQSGRRRRNFLCKILLLYHQLGTVTKKIRKCARNCIKREKVSDCRSLALLALHSFSCKLNHL